MIGRRLADPNFPVEQRIYWVAAGFLLAPGRYALELQDLGEVRNYLRPLLEFFCRVGFRREIAQRFGVNELRLMIVLTRNAMDDRELTIEKWRFMSDLIHGLSSLRSEDAADVLQETSRCSRVFGLGSGHCSCNRK